MNESGRSLRENKKMERCIAYIVSGNGSSMFCETEEDIQFWVEFYNDRYDKAYVFRKDTGGDEVPSASVVDALS